MNIYEAKEALNNRDNAIYLSKLKNILLAIIEEIERVDEKCPPDCRCNYCWG